MTRFESADELRATLQRLAEAQRLRTSRRLGTMDVEESAAEPAPTVAADSVDGAGAESITNNQVAGIDEGGIVKTHGEHLVVLRRGRLFSVRLGDASLTPISMVDACPRGAVGGNLHFSAVSLGPTPAVVGH